MPVIFKSDKREPVVIEKDGTRFYFDLTPGKQRQIRINMYAAGSRDIGAMAVNAFRVALYKWDNLQDADGNQVPFSEAVRDALVNESDVFSDDDVSNVVMPEKKTVGADTPETLTTGSETPVSGTGTPTGAEIASQPDNADSPEDCVN